MTGRRVAALCVLLVNLVLVSAERDWSTFLWNKNDLLSVKAKLKESSEFAAAAAALKSAASHALDVPPLSVTNKTLIPPNGNKHFYESVAIYNWPCDATPKGCTPYPGEKPLPPSECNNSTGLPWVPCDGQVDTSAVDAGDAPTAGKFMESVVTLAQAGFFFDDDAYFTKAADLIRVFCVNSASYMVPELLYGQSQPGRNNGSHGVMIEWTRLSQVADAAALMRTASTDVWSDDDDKAYSSWLCGLFTFIANSPVISGEFTMSNNHAVWADQTRMALSLYCGNNSYARSVADAVPSKRIDTQIAPDGNLPIEVERTKSAHYFEYCAQAFVNVGVLATGVDATVFNYTSSDGRSIKKVFEFVMPYATGKEKWPYKDIEPMNWASFFPLYRVVSKAYNDPAFESAICDLTGFDATVYNSSVTNLLYPRSFPSCV